MYKISLTKIIVDDCVRDLNILSILRRQKYLHLNSINFAPFFDCAP